MNIINLNIKDIIPYKNNAKKHDKTQINNVAESIKQFGMVQPIVIDKNNEIVIGHCRYEALKKLKRKEAPCVIADDLTEEQIKKLRNLDNKLNESDWDYDLLKFDIEDLDFSDFDIDWEIPEFEYANENDFSEDFTLPDGDKSEICQITFTLHEKQKELIDYAIGLVKNDVTETFGNSNSNGNAIYEVIRQWAEQKKYL